MTDLLMNAQMSLQPRLHPGIRMCVPDRLRLISAVVFMCAATYSMDSVSAQVVAPEVPAECRPEIVVLRPGVTLTLFAEHPEVMTPTGIDVDEQGRVWVACSHTHFRPVDYPGPEHDQILILSDHNGDGRADRRDVFYEQTTATMDLELGPAGWVYLAERSRILRVRDTDDDGRGDEAQDIAVLETTSDYPHNGLSGLAWHPDGDLTFSLGENYASEWTLTSADGKVFHGTGEGGIFRCRPDGSNLRRIAKGFWNPFGVCVRGDGEIFAAENDPGSQPPCRLLHLVQEGDYGYQRRYGNAPMHPFVCWNGELRGTLPMIHATGEAPCGIAPLGGGLLVPSWADHRIDFFPLFRHGATFATERIEVVTGSDFFRPTCITQMSESVYFLSDWVFGSYELHQRGRIWRLEIDRQHAEWIQPAVPEPPTDLSLLASRLRSGSHELPEQELFHLAQDADPFLAAASLTALEGPAKDWTPESVCERSADDRVTAALVLHRIVPNDDQWIALFLSDDDPDVRFEALRWIADETRAAFRDDIDRLLDGPDLDFRLFEAALAASNTLDGKPDAGVSEPRMLLARVQNDEFPPRLRAYALRLLDPQDKSLSPNFLQKLIASDDEELQFEAIRTLALRDDSQTRDLLFMVAADRDRSSHLRAEAIVGLSGDSPSTHELLLTLAEEEDDSVREEALRGLRFAMLPDDSRHRIQEIGLRYPDSADLVQAALHPESLAEERRSTTDIAAWRHGSTAWKACQTLKAVVGSSHTGNWPTALPAIGGMGAGG